ncbi:MAG: putative sugar phosphatase of the superfamily [Verrucomicrobiales bacterium]|nr:putative sugar phosphatase of the superfamily [Verrucomicrobiales bacterium]
MNHRLRNIRHLALDMDGTIYKGSTLFEFTKPFLKSLTEMGIGYTFLTNNPSKSVKDYLAKLGQLGIEAGETQLYTSTQCTIEYLQQTYPKVKRLFALGTPSMCDEFRKAGFEICENSHLDEPDAVVVAFDMTLEFSRVGRAAWWIQKGKPYVATNPDRVCPTDQPTIWVDCAAICAMLEQATGRNPDKILGKPDPSMLRGILQRHGLKPSELAMIGDRTYTDVAMGQRSGAVSVLVLTGECTLEDGQKYSPPPDFILPSIKELGEMLRDAKKEAVA